MNLLLASVLLVLWKTAFIWVPILIFCIFMRIWIRYVQKEFIDNIDWALLSIKIPREVHKSPEAMEIMLQAINDTGGTADWFLRWWKGQVRLWFSLEIISIEGSLYFFIRTPRKYKDFVTTQIYSQYPQSEVQEVDDYVRYVPKYIKSNEWSLFGSEVVLAKDDVYPIKTYIDYGIDRALSLDAEQRIDPITPILEFFSSMRKGEQIWMQILVRAATKKPFTGVLGVLWEFVKGKDWTESAQDEVKSFLEKHASKKFKSADGVEKKEIDLQLLTPGKKNILEALERSVTKHGFDVGIRWIYLAPKDKFRGTNIPALLALFRQYNSAELNGFKPKNMTAFDFPWQDIRGRKLEKMKMDMFDAYMRRSYFYEPYKNKHFILNVEELATIFHFPGSTAETPSFERIESKKSEPPIDLPM